MLNPRPSISASVTSGIRLRTMTLPIAGMLIGFWIFIGALYLLSVILNGQKFDRPLEINSRLLLGNLLIYLSWGLFNVGMMAAVRRFSAVGTIRLYASLVLGAAVLWIPLNLLIDASLADWMFSRPSRQPSEIFSQTNFFSVFFVVMLYLIVFFASFGWTYLERWQATREAALGLEKQAIKQQLELADLRMKVLRSQLSPHFLFNALGSISALIRSAPPAQANSAIQTLGDMLRFTLATGEQPLIRLSAELAFTQNYLSLQKLRFADRFQCQLQADAVPPSTQCPPFVLQTLVENAFTHGVEQREQRSVVEASVQIINSQLHIKVRNPMPQSTQGAENLGLAVNNLKKRLQLMFPGDYRVKGETLDGHYLASVVLPIKVPQ